MTADGAIARKISATVKKMCVTARKTCATGVKIIRTAAKIAETAEKITVIIARISVTAAKISGTIATDNLMEMVRSRAALNSAALKAVPSSVVRKDAVLMDPATDSLMGMDRSSAVRKAVPRAALNSEALKAVPKMAR
jgi:hypothetical protein